MTIEEAMQVALQRHRAGKLAEAELVYRQVLTASPHNADALNLFGVLACQIGHPEMAVSRIGHAITVNPRIPEYYVNLGTALDETGHINEAVAAYQQALSINPDYALALSNLGNSLRKLGMTQQAISACKHALELQPSLATAHNNLGVALQHDHIDQAILEFKQAIAARPDFGDAYNSLGSAMLEKGEVDEAVVNGRKAVSLRPDCAQAHNNLGNALAAAGDVVQATAAFREALHLKPDFALARWNLSLMLLLRGDFEHGWPDYESRLKVKEFPSHAKISTPRWNGQPLNGRRILLHAEQGLGDVIQFIRLVPEVIKLGGRINVACHRPLHRLLKQVPGVERWTWFDEPLPQFDVHCPLLSLPAILHIHQITPQLPYLKADPTLKCQWLDRLPTDGRKKIGLVWAGCPTHHNNRNRSMPPDMLAPLADLPNAFFCSLQKNFAPPTSHPPIPLADWTDEIHDFAQTASLIDNLDLVITVDTAVAHLAGAMGKPVWVLLPFMPDWRWMLGRSDSPWYPGMRLFRQTKCGDWQTPMNQIVEALRSCDH